MTEYQPDRFGSQDQADFNAAYRHRPVLASFLFVLHGTVIISALAGGALLLFGEFLRAVVVFGVGAVSFACWAVIHNWALTHPKYPK